MQICVSFHKHHTLSCKSVLWECNTQRHGTYQKLYKGNGYNIQGFTYLATGYAHNCKNNNNDTNAERSNFKRVIICHRFEKFFTLFYFLSLCFSDYIYFLKSITNEIRCDCMACTFMDENYIILG